MKIIYRQVQRLSMIILSIGLIGCQSHDGDNASQESDEFMESMSSLPENADNNFINQLVSLDPRFIPEYAQVEQEILMHPDYLFTNQAIFRSTIPFHTTNPTYQFQVNQSGIYEFLMEDGETPALARYGAVVLLEVSLTNRTNQDLVYPTEDVQLIIGESSDRHIPDNLWLSNLGGDLTSIMRLNRYKIPPVGSVTGFLVFEVPADEWMQYKAQGYMTLEGNHSTQMMPPIYLPLNNLMQERLAIQQSMIQDQLTVDWLGNKELIAREGSNRLFQHELIDVSVQRMELTEFIPNEISTVLTETDPLTHRIALSIQLQITNLAQVPIELSNISLTGQTSKGRIEASSELSDWGEKEILLANERKDYTAVLWIDRVTYIDDWQGRTIHWSLFTKFKDYRQILENNKKVAHPEQIDDTSIEMITPKITETFYRMRWRWLPELIQIFSIDEGQEVWQPHHESQ